MENKYVINHGKWHIILNPKANLEGAWMTAEEIGRHLEYENPRISVMNIYKRHREQFKNQVDYSVINLITESGERKTSIFSERGVLKILRYSDTEVANKIIEHIFDVFLEAKNPMEELIAKQIKERFFLPAPEQWEKRFPDSLAKAACKMYGIDDFVPGDSHLRLANFYAQYIYMAAPANIYDLLLEVNPKDGNGERRYKHHQFLSKEAKDWLVKHIATIESFIRAAKYNVEIFRTLFKTAFPYVGNALLIEDVKKKIDQIQVNFDFE